MKPKTTSTHHILRRKIRFLSNPAIYPDHPLNIKPRETHYSWIFIGDNFVHKMKKPVLADLLDFSTLEARKRNCYEEYRLNQILAPDIYLDVVPLCQAEDKQFNLAGEGDVVEWLVKMKRIPDENLLDNVIKHGRVNMSKVEEAARRLAAFYLDSNAELLPEEDFIHFYQQRINHYRHEMEDDFFEMDKEKIDGLCIILFDFLGIQQKQLIDRMYEGRVKEVHGDLRPEHICIYPKPLFIDRLEFSKRLRTMDIAQELAFLDMECCILGRRDIGKTFRKIYQETNRDNIPEMLYHCYFAFRALVRSRQSIVHLLEVKYQGQKKWKRKADLYLQEAINAAAFLP